MTEDLSEKVTDIRITLARLEAGQEKSLEYLMKHDDRISDLEGKVKEIQLKNQFSAGRIAGISSVAGLLSSSAAISIFKLLIQN